MCVYVVCVVNKISSCYKYSSEKFENNKTLESSMPIYLFIFSLHPFHVFFLLHLPRLKSMVDAHPSSVLMQQTLREFLSQS